MCPRKISSTINQKNYNMNNHVITGGFKSIRKQMYKLYIEYQPDMKNKALHT